EVGNDRDGRVSVRLAECQSADHPARGSTIHGARESRQEPARLTMDPVVLAFMVIGALLIVASIVAAQRFARRREREGLWDKNGPINPTSPPGDWGLPPGYGAHRPEIEEDDGEEPEHAE